MDVFVRKTELEKLLLRSWASLADSHGILKRTLEDARDADYQAIQSKSPVPVRTSMTISKLEITSKGLIELWMEFTIPRQDGLAVGTHIYEMDLLGKASLLRSFGTVFLAEND